MIIGTGNIDISFAFAFSEQEWARLLAMFPAVTAADLDAERKALESVATAYLNLSHHHRLRSANGFPTKGWKARRKRIANDLAMAEKNGKSDQVCVLREELRQADVAVEAFGVLGKAHQRRGDPARDWLYDAALAMWQRLDGRMGITRGLYGRGKPSGPLIDFMASVLAPVMGDDAPGAEAIKKRIKQRRT